MKILFFSDIHGITNNLNVIQEKMNREKFDKIVCLGDLYYSGPTYDCKYIVNSGVVLEFLTKYADKLICMKGNCDAPVDLKASDFPICDGISLINVDGLNITHGNEYNIEKNRKFKHKGILIYGHEHIPNIKKQNDMIYINVGSISLPKNEIATYGIYEDKKFTIFDINNRIVDSIEF